MNVLYKEQFEKILFLKNILNTEISNPLHNEKIIEFIKRELKINEERFILQTLLNNNFTKIETIINYTVLLNIREFKLSFDRITYDIIQLIEINKNPNLNIMLSYKNYYLRMIKILGRKLIVNL
jgi:hypothetical protein